MARATGTARPRQHRVHIIGGGFSGLMAAYFCSKNSNLDIVISEAENWGGILTSEQTPWGLAEHSANGMMRTELLTQVAADLGVELLSSLPGAKQRWIANEVPERLPVGLADVAGGAARYLMNRALGRHLPRPHESLIAWGDRVLGADISHRLLLPAMQGIYALDGRHLSASLVMGPVFRKDRPRRGGFCAARGGMQDWIDQLRRGLRAAGVLFVEEKVTRWPDADHVILATGAASKALLLQERSLKASHLFAKVRTHSMISVNTYWEKTNDDFPGFGVLFHPDHGWKTSGVLFNNQIFENRSPHRSERYFFARTDDMKRTDDELLADIHAQRERLGWKNKVLGVSICRWPQALPIYSIELEKILAADFDLPTRGLTLLGNELGEIGLTSLAERAQAAAEKIRAELAGESPDERTGTAADEPQTKGPRIRETFAQKNGRS